MAVTTNEEVAWGAQQQAAAGRPQHWLIEAALLAIESANAPKSKIPKENSPVL